MQEVAFVCTMLLKILYLVAFERTFKTSNDGRDTVMLETQQA